MFWAIRFLARVVRQKFSSSVPAEHVSERPVIAEPEGKRRRGGNSPNRGDRHRELRSRFERCRSLRNDRTFVPVRRAIHMVEQRDVKLCANETATA